MNHRAAGRLDAASTQCLVCEKIIVNDEWFARVKHGDLTVVLCTKRCAKVFYAQQLPGLRRLMLLAAHPSLQWPRANISFEKLAATP